MNVVFFFIMNGVYTLNSYFSGVKNINLTATKLPLMYLRSRESDEQISTRVWSSVCKNNTFLLIDL
jgi:hypothetical protein